MRRPSLLIRCVRKNLDTAVSDQPPKGNKLSRLLETSAVVMRCCGRGG